jgi:hypothetical protein
MKLIRGARVPLGWRRILNNAIPGNIEFFALNSGAEPLENLILPRQSC